MIEHLRDYKVTLIVDGETHRITTLARNPLVAKRDAIIKARTLLKAKAIEVKRVAVVSYKPLV